MWRASRGSITNATAESPGIAENVVIAGIISPVFSAKNALAAVPEGLWRFHARMPCLWRSQVQRPAGVLRLAPSVLAQVEWRVAEGRSPDSGAAATCA